MQPTSCIPFHATICNKFELLKESKRDVAGEALGLVCEMLGIGMQEIKSNSRSRKLVLARSLFFKLVREVGMERVSLKAIGDLVNQRDHSTVLHSLKTLDMRMNQFPELYQVYISLKAKLSREYSPYSLTAEEINIILYPIIHGIDYTAPRPKTKKKIEKAKKEREIREKIVAIKNTMPFIDDEDEPKVTHSPDPNYSYRSRHAK